VITSPIRDAQPGDVWLYARTDPGSRMIAMKTWSRFTHVEVAVAERHTLSGVELLASRIKGGVRFYQADLSGLALVLRSSRPFNQIAAMQWANTVVGQPYDFTGLMCFWFAELQGQNNKAQFCSELATRFLRRGGIDLFPGLDADGVAPSYFGSNPYLDVVWRSWDEQQRWHQRQRQEIA
jgi:uncharacterized protein YycO